MRHRGRPHRRIQASPRPCPRGGRASTGPLRRPSARAGDGGAPARPRPRLGRGDRGRRAGSLHPCPRHRSALHPLHVRHDWDAEGRRPGQRRSCGRPPLEHGGHLRHASRRGVLGGVRPRLGGRTLLHRLRTPPGRLYHGSLRGKAGRNARPRRVLARDRGAPSQGPLHRPDGLSRDQEGRSGRHLPRRPRSRRVRLSVPGGRAPRPRYVPLGIAAPRRVRDRPLVADRERLADGGELHRDRAAARESRVAVEAGARLRHPHPRRGRHGDRRSTEKGRSRSGFRCLPGRCRRYGARTTASSIRT